MIAVMSGFEIHVGDVLHVCRSLEALVLVPLVVRSQSSFRPFLSSGRFTIQTFLSLVQIIDYVVIIIFPVRYRLENSRICVERRLFLNEAT